MVEGRELEVIAGPDRMDLYCSFSKGDFIEVAAKDFISPGAESVSFKIVSLYHLEKGIEFTGVSKEGKKIYGKIERGRMRNIILEEEEEEGIEVLDSFINRNKQLEKKINSVVRKMKAMEEEERDISKIITFLEEAAFMALLKELTALDEALKMIEEMEGVIKES